MRIAILFTVTTMAGVAVGHGTASAQVLSMDRCPNGPATTSGVAQARYAWGVYCRANPLNSPGGTPYPADHYLTAASVQDYAANPTLQPFLYPTFFNQANFSPFDLPDFPGQNCAVLPTSAFNVGLCVAGCYTADTALRFSDGNVGIKAALDAGKLDLVTLAPEATLDNLHFVKNQVDRYTADIFEDWQTIYTFTMETGGTLSVTSEHPLVTSDGVMQQAQSLKVGDALIRADGSPDPVVSITVVEKFGKVYNVKPVTIDYVSNIVVAAGYLNGSQRYQNEFLDVVNSLILRRALAEQVDSLAGN